MAYSAIRRRCRKLRPAVGHRFGATVAPMSRDTLARRDCLHLALLRKANAMLNFDSKTFDDLAARIGKAVEASPAEGRREEREGDAARAVLRGSTSCRARSSTRRPPCSRRRARSSSNSRRASRRWKVVLAAEVTGILEPAISRSTPQFRGSAMRRMSMLMLFWAFAGGAYAHGCPGAPGWAFVDVAAGRSRSARQITWLAERGVTLGCEIIDGRASHVLPGKRHEARPARGLPLARPRGRCSRSTAHPAR